MFLNQVIALYLAKIADFKFSILSLATAKAENTPIVLLGVLISLVVVFLLAKLVGNYHAGCEKIACIVLLPRN